MSNIETIVKELTSKHSHEKEFVQAVNEVMESIVPFVNKNSKYRKLDERFFIAKKSCSLSSDVKRNYRNLQT